MNWISDTIIGLAISQLAFLGAFALYHHRRQMLGRLLVVFSVCLSAYLLTNLSGMAEHPLLRSSLLRLAIVTPAVLWIISLHLFIDNVKIPRLMWGVLAFYLLARGVGATFYTSDMPLAEFWYVTLHVLPQLIMMGIAIHAVYVAWTGRGDDLVEERRRVRVPFVASMGVVVAVILGNGFFTAAGVLLERMDIVLLPLRPWLFAAYIFLITFAFNLKIFRLHSDAFDLIVQPAHVYRDHRIRQIGRPEPELISQIYKTMEDGKLYRVAGLTIGDLANTLSVQEYRLRKVINKQMDYRNFHQLLNRFRIDEACKRLRETDDPIATIAMEVGYSSLSSFNKAFKDEQGVTPRQYRSSPPGQSGGNDSRSAAEP